jgi:GNAT superfamily N-acetyltransferase
MDVVVRRLGMRHDRSNRFDGAGIPADRYPGRGRPLEVGPVTMDGPAAGHDRVVQTGARDPAVGLPVEIRIGSAADLPIALRLLDDAVAWLVSLGRTGQWGSTPFSASDARRAQIERILGSGIARIAEVEGEPAGLTVLMSDPPAYVAPARVPELYIHLLVTDRTRRGAGIARVLVDEAAALGLERGAEQLRVDCFAGSAGGLVDAYRRLGFAPVETFAVERAGQSAWPGCLLTRPLRPRRAGPLTEGGEPGSGPG